MSKQEILIKEVEVEGRRAVVMEADGVTNEFLICSLISLMAATSKATDLPKEALMLLFLGEDPIDQKYGKFLKVNKRTGKVSDLSDPIGSN